MDPAGTGDHLSFGPCGPVMTTQHGLGIEDTCRSIGSGQRSMCLPATYSHLGPSPISQANYYRKQFYSVASLSVAGIICGVMQWPHFVLSATRASLTSVPQ